MSTLRGLVVAIVLRLYYSLQTKKLCKHIYRKSSSFIVLMFGIFLPKRKVRFYNVRVNAHFDVIFWILLHTIDFTWCSSALIQFCALYANFGLLHISSSYEIKKKIFVSTNFHVRYLEQYSVSVKVHNSN